MLSAEWSMLSGADRSTSPRAQEAAPPPEVSIHTYEQLLSTVLDAAIGVLGGKHVAPSTPLMDAGLDSMDAGLLVERLRTGTGL